MTCKGDMPGRNRFFAARNLDFFYAREEKNKRPVSKEGRHTL